MSFILNTTITINWVLEPDASPPAQADYDVYIIKPDGTATYNPGVLTSHTAPTATQQGAATYDLLVDQIGRWETRLLVGTDLIYVENSAQQVYIVDPPNVATIITSFGGLLNYDPPLFLLWPPAGEISDIVGIEWDSITNTSAPAGAANGNFFAKQSLWMDSTGKRLYISGAPSNLTNGYCFQYALSIAYDLDTISYIGYFSFSDDPELYFSPDGTKAVGWTRQTNTFRSYTLSVAYDITTIAVVVGDTYSIGTDFNGDLLTHFTASHDGLKLFLGDRNAYYPGGDHAIFEWNLSVAWDVSTAVPGNSWADPAGARPPFGTGHSISSSELYGLVFGGDGKWLFTSHYYGIAPEVIFAYLLSTPYDITTAIAVSGINYLVLLGSADLDKFDSFHVNITTGDLITFRDGSATTIELAHYSGLTLATWNNISEINDIVGTEFDSISGTNTPPSTTLYIAERGLWVDATGTRLYITANDTPDNNHVVFQYALSTPYDLTTISYINSGIIGSPVVKADIYISPDGTKLITVLSDRTFQSYTMSPAWDISSLTIVAGDSYNMGTDFSSIFVAASWVSADGTKIFVGSHNYLGGTVVQWDLSPAWDVSTATPSGNTFDFSTQISNPPVAPYTGDGDLFAMCISEDGFYLFLGIWYASPGDDPDIVWMYKMDSPYDLTTATLVPAPDYYILQNTVGDKLEGLFVNKFNGHIITFMGSGINDIELSHHA